MSKNNKISGRKSTVNTVDPKSFIGQKAAAKQKKNEVEQNQQLEVAQRQPKIQKVTVVSKETKLQRLQIKAKLIVMSNVRMTSMEVKRLWIKMICHW